MKIAVRHASLPDHVCGIDTKMLRDHFLVESMFEADDIVLTHSHIKRFVVGGAMPVNGPRWHWRRQRRSVPPPFWCGASWA